MEGVFFLLALVVCVHGTSHLSFSNDTSEVIVTRSGCGVKKSCVSSPSGCDPAEQSECLFASTAARDLAPPAAGVKLAVELRGDSAGYIALGLAADATEGNVALFVCASNNGTFFFRTLQGNNTPNAPLTPTETRVKGIRGTVSGNVIKCQFTVESLNAASLNAAQSRSSRATTFFVRLGNGTVTGDAVGVFSTVLDLGALDLAAAPSETTTVTTTTVTPGGATTTVTTNSTGNNSPTTDGGGAVRPHAALLLLSVLTLSVLMRG
ncbi:putative ferric-chelate reductase 1 [Pseudoliparis swirei]|uniref:putative ferric-chelate reductase 1 n=1 Tax=Pseudoliparis swirei TaxID=2059687 RepID=UPI0024BE46BF|nr:putative ferric-chelate reductase 1 [Pseudoliparis swirei]